MEPVQRVVVDVTFLEMLHPPTEPAQELPPGWRLVWERFPPVSLYRNLHWQVGRAHCWWMRLVKSDPELAAILDEPKRHIFLLQEDGETRGFCELDFKPHKTVNLAYFGLFPEVIGRGVGRAFLSQALALAWSADPLRVTVNTCTADHPRALTGYLRAGFRIVGVNREEWDIPLRLGLSPPAHLCI